MKINTDSIVSTNGANHNSLKAEDIQTASDKTIADISEKLIAKYLEAYNELLESAPQAPFLTFSGADLYPSPSLFRKLPDRSSHSFKSSLC